MMRPKPVFCEVGEIYVLWGTEAGIGGQVQMQEVERKTNKILVRKTGSKAQITR